MPQRQAFSCALRLWPRRTCLQLALRHATTQAPAAQADAIDGTPLKTDGRVPGALSALWLRLRALDGLLCRDLCDRLFQHKISLFPGLRLKRANSTALSA